MRFLFGIFLSLIISSAHALLPIAADTQQLVQQTEKASDYAEAADAMESYLKKLEFFAQDASFEFELCQTLFQLSEKDLLLFQPRFKESVFLNLYCITSLEERTTHFLENSKLKIQQTYKPFQRSDRREALNEPRAEEKLGPSLDRIIDPAISPVYFSGDLPTSHFSLTFDDGPHSSLTDKLLDILKAEDVQATFFMVGDRIVRSSSIIQRMIDDNHSLGTHSYTHAQLTKLPYDQAVSEIEDTFKALFAVAGNKMDAFFRFPYGARSASLQNYVKASQRATFFWNIDTLDWQKRDPAVLFEYAMAQTSAARKGIILFHDVQPQTIAMMPQFLRALKLKGYQIEVFRTSKTSSIAPQ